MCMGGAAGLLGAGVSMMGSMMQAGAAMEEGRRAKEISEVNARRLREQGAYQARQIRLDGMRANGTAAAQAGGRGLQLAGSVLDVMLDSAVASTIDAYNTQKQADDEADVRIMEGEAAQARAQAQATSAIIGGFSGFLRMAA